MDLNKKEVQKIAQLARLKVDEKELDSYTKELSSVLGYVQQLNEADTGSIEEKLGGNDLFNALREDKQRKSFNASLLLKLAPLVEKGMVKVKAVFKK